MTRRHLCNKCEGIFSPSNTHSLVIDDSREYHLCTDCFTAYRDWFDTGDDR